MDFLQDLMDFFKDLTDILKDLIDFLKDLMGFLNGLMDFRKEPAQAGWGPPAGADWLTGAGWRGAHQEKVSKKKL